MRNSNLLTHIKHDPNAIKHIGIGTFVSLPVAYIAWWLPAIAALTTGIAIEVYQRTTGGKNTMRESVMDALTTAIPGILLSVILAAAQQVTQTQGVI